MKPSLLAVLAAVTACGYDGKQPFNPDNADELTGPIRIAGTLAYGHTAKGELSAAGSPGYTFAASAGDVVSVYAAGLPRGTGVDPIVLLYASDGGGGPGDKPLAAHDDISDPQILDAHLHAFTIPSTGTYTVVVAERTKQSAAYRVRLACDGGPCSPVYTTRREASCQPSEHARQVHAAVLGANPKNKPVPDDLVMSMRNAVGPALASRSPRLFPAGDAPYPPIFPALGDLIAAAQFEIDIRASNIGPSDPLDDILDGVARLESRLRIEGRHGDPVVVRLIADTFEALSGSAGTYAKMLHDAFRPLHLDENLVKVEILTYQHFGVHEDHSKIIVVDGTYVHIGGANPEQNNNYDRAENDAAFLLKGQVATAAVVDFDFSWNNQSTNLWRCTFNGDVHDDCSRVDKPAIVHRAQVMSPDWEAAGLPADACLPMIYMGKRGTADILTNAIDEPLDQGVLAAMKSAKLLLRLESPNLGDDAVMNELVAALLRDPTVRVQSLVPPHRNDSKNGLPFGGGSNEQNYTDIVEMINKAHLEIGLSPAKQTEVVGRFQYRWHPIEGDGPGAQHTKYVSVDHQLAIVGSLNLDTQSFNRARETSIAIDDPATTRLWDDELFVPDFSIAAEAQPNQFDDGQIE